MISVALLAVFLVTVFTSLMFTGADQAIGLISRDSLEKMAENNVPGAGLVLHMVGRKRRFQLMLLTGRIVSVIAGTVVLVIFFSRVLSGVVDVGWGSSLAAFLVSTLVFVAADGIFARILSVGEHEVTVSRFASFLSLFHVLFFPFTALMDAVLTVFIKKNLELAAKEEALKEFVKSESESGVIEEEEGEMIQGVLSFYDTTAREVMVPRIDVVAADVTIPVTDLITLFRIEGHSRIPIYEDRIDNIVGVIYSKDLLIAIAERGKDRVSVAEIMRKPYFVPEAKKLSELLKDLRKARTHLAIVVDEYGGTSGIVALEDLLEEIVGDIQDEYDQDEGDFTWIDSQTVIMDAGLNIDDVNDILRVDIPNENFDTLAGFIYHQLGFIPEGGEEVVWGEMRFIIKEIIGNRISKVVVKLPEPRPENEHTEV